MARAGGAKRGSPPGRGPIERLGSAAAAALLLSAPRLCAAPTSSGSVWWEWWNSTADCIKGKDDDPSHHQEWTYDSECLHSHQLRLDDPLTEIADAVSYNATGTTGLDFDVKVHCLNSTETRKLNLANNDSVQISLYHSLDLTCTDLLRSFIVIREDCGTTVLVRYPNGAFGPLLDDDADDDTNSTNSTVSNSSSTNGTTANATPTASPSARRLSLEAGFARMRVHCSSCNWYFKGESAPPYSLQAVGVAVFLAACVLLNFLFQDYLDRLLKVFPVWAAERVPCIKTSKDEQEEWESNRIHPGALVLLVSPPRGFWCEPTSNLLKGPYVPREQEQHVDASTAKLVLARVPREPDLLGGIDVNEEEPTSPLESLARTMSQRRHTPGLRVQEANRKWDRGFDDTEPDRAWAEDSLTLATQQQHLSTPLSQFPARAQTSEHAVSPPRFRAGAAGAVQRQESIDARVASILQCAPPVARGRRRQRFSADDSEAVSEMLLVVDAWSRPAAAAPAPSPMPSPLARYSERGRLAGNRSPRTVPTVRSVRSDNGLEGDWMVHRMPPSVRSQHSPHSASGRSGAGELAALTAIGELLPLEARGGGGGRPKDGQPPDHYSRRRRKRGSDPFVPASNASQASDLVDLTATARSDVGLRTRASAFGSALSSDYARHLSTNGTSPEHRRGGHSPPRAPSGGLGGSGATFDIPRMSGLLDPEDAVTAYRQHSAPPSRGALLADDLVAAYWQHSSKARSYTQAALAHPLGRPDTVGAAHMCIVCGRCDRDTERTRSGFKCHKCKGHHHSQVLQLHAWSCGHEDKFLQQKALEGCFGRSACVLGQGRSDGRDLVLLSFRRPRCWIRTEVLIRVRALPVVLDTQSAHECMSQWPRHTVPPDGELEALWVRLCEGCGGYSVAHQVTEGQQQGWSAIELRGDFVVWVGEEHVQKLHHWGGDYARLCRKKEMKDASGDSWESWWGDFELNVAEVQRVVQPAPSEPRSHYKALIKFHTAKTRPKDALKHESKKAIEAAQIARKNEFTGATFLLPVNCLWRATQKQCDAEYLVIPQPVHLRTMYACFVASTPPILAVKALLNMLIFAQSIQEALRDGHSGSANNHNNWEAYEEAYFKLFNSSYPTLLADCATVTAFFIINYRPTFKQFYNGIGSPILFTIGLAVVICFPGLCTHAIPMIFFYFWLWGPLILVVVIVTRLVWRRPKPPDVDRARMFDMRHFACNSPCSLFKASVTYLFFRVLAEMLVMTFLQTNFNYGVLTYEGRHAYFEIIGAEFESRTMACVLETAEKRASIFL
eukprot:TRINITY_DN50450_c0_g1_i1.p1 TRINITY_DN50450_c0_g1~~TRINITY_DN50450_c0_g1_i1.p1  ORF type:complete len:1293 (+),score=335.95 TRINITY_DN50450_c0_g1_i1:104-3982(+)